MKVTDKITITNEDNMALMARYPDNYFDLAIVDPPYGIDAFKQGAKWQQEQIGKSEFLQRLRGTLSDAEARRLIFETFKKK